MNSPVRRRGVATPARFTSLSTRPCCSLWITLWIFHWVFQYIKLLFLSLPKPEHNQDAAADFKIAELELKTLKAHSEQTATSSGQSLLYTLHLKQDFVRNFESLFITCIHFTRHFLVYKLYKTITFMFYSPNYKLRIKSVFFFSNNV